MDCNFLVWNVRGLNNPARRAVVRSVIFNNNVSVLCLQESKLEFVDLGIVQQFCGSRFSDFIFAPSVGTRGGLILAWDNAMVDFCNPIISASFIAAEGVFIQSGSKFKLINVYGPQDDQAKLVLLDDLKQVVSGGLPVGAPCILAGDFNLIARATDKNNLNINRRLLAAFRSFINELQLRDLYLHGRRYTWSNEQENATMVKLDRVLFNEEWDALFPSCLLQALSSEMSDHCPLLLSCDADFKPFRRFRFENHWVRLEGFHQTVSEAWQQNPNCNDACSRLHSKLISTGRALRKWNSCMVGDLRLRAAVSSELIFMLDQAMDKRMLSADERQFRAMLKVNCLGIAALQRSMWRQRSRITQVREGHASTRFFQAKATARRRKSFIHRLMVDGVPVTSQVGKEQAMFDFFSQLLGRRRVRTSTLNLQNIELPAVELSELERPILEDEVKAVLFDLDPSKAPGPDGYSALFFQSCWDTIKFDIMAAIREIENLNARKLHLLNSATIVLLPKNPEASTPRDFRPISLINFISKLFMKILASRLRCRMNDLVQPCQSAFIKGRTIHDNFKYVHCLAKMFKQSKTPAVMLKLDIEKAFDSVSWEFLLQVLEAKGFGTKFRDWISVMLSTATSKVLVNGALTDSIYHQQGLRQGDPMSPLLFVIVMDCLAALINAAVEAEVLKPTGSSRMPFRTSLYADDAVIFINPDPSEIASIKQLLQLFGNATGLHTNFEKSSFTPICCEGLNLSLIMGASMGACKKFPCKYLGMPLSDSRLKMVDYEEYIDKILSKVRCWKLGLMGLDGRLMLVKQVLSAMVVFQMIALAQPIWLHKLIDKIRRGFLWECKGVAVGGKCLVSWKLVCRPKMYGGLGISNLQAQGMALRLRWLWQSWNEPDKPWACLPMTVDKKLNDLFNASVKFVLGNGERIKFWYEPWLNGVSLSCAAPDLFACCTRKNLTVSQALQDGRWIRHLRRPLTPAAIIQYTKLWEAVADVHLLLGTPDSVIWRWTPNGAYSSATAYAVQFEGCTRLAGQRHIWAADAPLKCRIFAWLAILEKCLTADNLQKRGWPHDPICSLCRAADECVDHLLARCSYTQALWSLMLNRCNLPTTLAPTAATTSLADWWVSNVVIANLSNSKGWGGLAVAIWWFTWCERNARIFQSKASTVSAVFNLMIDEFRIWNQAGRHRFQLFLDRPREPD